MNGQVGKQSEKSGFWNSLFIVILPCSYLAGKGRGNVTNNGVHPKHGVQRRFVKAIAPFRDKETDVLKKKFAIGGLVLATATGAIFTSSPSYAQPGPGGFGGGWGGGWWSGQNFRHFSNHRNWNFNGNSMWNMIRLRIRNRNNNIAIARNDQAQAQRENQFQFDRQRQREQQDLIDRERDRDRDQRDDRGAAPGAPGV